jgi:hypothetical protein
MLASAVSFNKPKRLTGLGQKARSGVRVLHGDPTRIMILPAYRANLTHPVPFMEHGNTADLARFRDRADLTARRVRRRSIGRTEKANASGNALDMPTSVWSILARELVEPTSEKESK